MVTKRCYDIIAALPIVSFFHEYAKSIWSLVLFVLNHYHHHGTDSATTLVPEAYEELKKDDGLQLECVVCLNEVSTGEKYKILPKCKHSFHSHCIDAWLNLHSTCPLCRSPTPRIPVRHANNDDKLLYGALRSYFLSGFGNFCQWLADPVSQELMLAICEDCKCYL